MKIENVKKNSKGKGRKYYRNLYEEEKYKKREYACNQYRKIFIENELSGGEKNEIHLYARSLYKNLSKEEKDKTHEIHVKNIEIFLKNKKYQYARERYRNLSKKL